MSDEKLRAIAIRWVRKGYPLDNLRYSDDLYNATADEIEKCIDYVCEIQERGISAFESEGLASDPSKRG